MYLSRLTLIAILSSAALHGWAQPDDWLDQARVITLRDALVICIEQNLNIRAEALEPVIQRQDVEILDADFDPALFGSLYANEDNTPSSSSLTAGGFNQSERQGARAGVRQTFETGLEADLSFDTLRSQNNSRVQGLSPQYQSYLTLNLTQPILKGFGANINTTQLRIARNDVQAAIFAYQDRIRQIAYQVERSYYQLSEAIEVYHQRIESKKLAQILIDGNRQKFDAGLVPISEVQQAESAAAARDEQIVLARQNVEIASNRLNDLLEFRNQNRQAAPMLASEPLQVTPYQPMEFDECMSAALEQRPDWQEQQLNFQNWDIRLEYSRNQLYPSLDLESTLTLNGLSGVLRGASIFDENGDQLRNPHAGGYFDSYGNMVEGEGYTWYVGLRVEFPLGNRAARARLRMSEEQKKQALLELQRMQGSIETEIKNGQVNQSRSWERILAAERFVHLAQTTLDQEMQKLQEGATDAFHVLDLQDDLVDARLRLISARADFLLGEAELFNAMGATMKRLNIYTGVERGLFSGLISSE
ncbi:MAG: hypothetical protein GC154_15455 [bacterium]|nr:hypothetical protein [bacterium]